MSLPGKGKKILIISQFYYPDVTACAFRIKETVDLLLAKGHTVHVIAGEPHKGQIKGQQIDDGNATVTRVKLFKYSGKGKWNYILHYLSFMFGAVAASFKHPSRFDVVWASSPPLFTAISGYFVSLLKKATFALDIRDIWPESAAVAGQISPDGFLFKAAKKVEKFVYDRASLITCVAKPMASYIEQVSGGKKPTIIYNAIPGSMVPEEVKPINESPEKLQILYVGNMGFCQNLSLVLDAAKILQERSEIGIEFLIVGNGIEKSMLEKRIEDEAINNVVIKGVIPKSEAIELIRTTEALMLHLKDDGTMDKTIPSKVFDYMAGGRPILFGLKGEACEILGSIGGNLYYDPADAGQLADQAINLKKNYVELAKKARENLNKVKSEFLRERMVDKLEKVFFDRQ